MMQVVPCTLVLPHLRHLPSPPLPSPPLLPPPLLPPPPIPPPSCMSAMGRRTTNLLCLLSGYLTGSPWDIVEIDEGVNDKEEVHRRNGHKIQQTWNNALKLLWVHTGCYEEWSWKSDKEDGWGRTNAILAQLQCGTHDDSHHDECVWSRHDLGHNQLPIEKAAPTWTMNTSYTWPQAMKKEQNCYTSDKWWYHMDNIQ